MKWALERYQMLKRPQQLAEGAEVSTAAWLPQGSRRLKVVLAEALSLYEQERRVLP